MWTFVERSSWTFSASHRVRYPPAISEKNNNMMWFRTMLQTFPENETFSTTDVVTHCLWEGDENFSRLIDIFIERPFRCSESFEWEKHVYNIKIQVPVFVCWVEVCSQDWKDEDLGCKTLHRVERTLCRTGGTSGENCKTKVKDWLDKSYSKVFVFFFTLGHGRLIFRMADLWRAIFIGSVGREMKNKKKFGCPNFFPYLRISESVGRAKKNIVNCYMNFDSMQF